MSDALKAVARRFSGNASPVWVWDVERARIAWANPPALAFFAETALADLTARPFAPANPLRAALGAIAARLREGGSVTERLKFRPGEEQISIDAEIFDMALGARRALVVRVLAGHAPDADPAFERAKLAFDLVARPLALFDAKGRCLLANAAFCETMTGEAALAALVGDADAVIERALGDGDAVLMRAVETRFGKRQHRLFARRAQDPAGGAALVFVEFADVEDGAALERRGEEKQPTATPEPEPHPAPAVLAEMIRLNVESVDVADLARQSARLAGPLAAREHVALSLDIADDLPRIAADRRSVAQAIANILDYAIGHGAGGGVRLRACVLADGAVELCVNAARRPAENDTGLTLAGALAEANHAEFVVENMQENNVLLRLVFPSPLVLAA